jgi:hypothetical protein
MHAGAVASESANRLEARIEESSEMARVSVCSEYKSGLIEPRKTRRAVYLNPDREDEKSALGGPLNTNLQKLVCPRTILDLSPWLPLPQACPRTNS